MQDLLGQVGVVADSDAAILVEGETGTGKEMVAETIHYNSRRRSGPFVAVSCVTLKDTIIESELFGHEKGAFSGAVRARPGRFELAHKGTIFLDDIDDVPLAVQPKLLRVLQNREFERVGGERGMAVDVRLIAATKRNLAALVEQKLFREDLYYRLNTIVLHLPPLRERKDDIPLFVEHFIRRYDRRPGRRFSSEALALLREYGWPGNVRELEHLVEAAVVLAREDEIQPAHLPKDFLRKIAAGGGVSSRGLKGDLAQIERETVTKALEKFDGNVAEAARHLGIARSTLRDRLKKLGIRAK
jgi:transcriptional regulator with GAF, ATPase, and Fis domain